MGINHNSEARGSREEGIFISVLLYIRKIETKTQMNKFFSFFEQILNLCVIFINHQIIITLWEVEFCVNVQKWQDVIQKKTRLCNVT